MLFLQINSARNRVLIAIFSFSKVVFSDSNKENTRSDVTSGEDTTDIDDRTVYDVRDYVILRDLGYMLLQFTRDLGHLIR